MEILIIIVGLVLLTVLVAAVFIKLKLGQILDEHDLVASLDKQINKMFKAPREHALVMGVYKVGRLYSQGYA